MRTHILHSPPERARTQSNVSSSRCSCKPRKFLKIKFFVIHTVHYYLVCFVENQNAEFPLSLCLSGSMSSDIGHWVSLNPIQNWLSTVTDFPLFHCSIFHKQIGHLSENEYVNFCAFFTDRLVMCLPPGSWAQLSENRPSSVLA